MSVPISATEAPDLVLDLRDVRKGYREGAWGVLIALFAGLFPLFSHLRARLEDD